MAPALIEAAGVTSRDRQSSGCTKTQNPCLVGKRLYHLANQKFLLREAKLSAEPTQRTSSSRVIQSTDLNSNTVSASQSKGKEELKVGSNQLISLANIDAANSKNNPLKTFSKDFDMNNSDNGICKTSCALDDETKLEPNGMVRPDIQMNTSKIEPTEIVSKQNVVDRKLLSALKRRRNKHDERFKEFEKRLDVLSRRIRTIQLNAISSHVSEELKNETLNNRGIRTETKNLCLNAASNQTNSKYGIDVGHQNGQPVNSTINVKNLVSSQQLDRSSGTFRQRIVSDHKESVEVLLHRSKLCKSFVDPDATESEPEDEDVPDNGRYGSTTTCSRWWKDRVLIGSRCTWLESHISDLDQKLKKYEDMSKALALKRTSLFGSVSSTCVEQKLVNENCCNDYQENAIRTLDQSRKNGILKGIHTDMSNKNIEPIITEHFCARTAPLQQRPTHKYLKKVIAKLEEKNGLSYTCPSLPTVATCLLCQKANINISTMVSGNARAAALDHSYHTKLSFDEDLLLPIHLEATMQQGGLDTKVKPINKMFSRKRDQEKKRRNTNCVSLNNLVAAAKAAKVKLSGHGLSQSLPSKLSNRSNVDNNKKRYAAINAANQIEKKARKLTVPRETGTRLSYIPSSGRNITHSQSASTLSQLVKKKRPSSAFDINNIVIPYSIACSTRVEKLKYKEIPTPGWRSLELLPSAKIQKLELNEEESTDEDTYAHRHAVCELEERKRFSVFFQPLRRSRSSRRNSECNTPEPHSPASNDEGRSSMSVSTPTDSGQSWVTSGKSGGRNLLWTQLKPEENAVPPWPRRVFPLSDEEMTLLNVSCTESNDGRGDYGFKDVGTLNLSEEVSTSKLEFPASSVKSEPQLLHDMEMSENDDLSPLSPTSELIDMDDEKWTVKLVSSEKATEQPGKNRKGIVLKLAKK